MRPLVGRWAAAMLRRAGYGGGYYEEVGAVGLTTDPDDGCIRVMRADGQQECYLVLSEEERGKGFVRPVRTTYRHVPCGVVTTMGHAIAETYARDPSFYGGTYCAGCRAHYPLYLPKVVDDEGGASHVERVPMFVWDEDGTAVGS